MFLDKVKITIKAGNGGKGCVSFYRSKLTINGGPDGGDGGAGGNIIFRASNHQNTLYGFKYKRKFVAENGKDGSGTHKTGASGADVVIDVPCGTVISDAESGKRLGFEAIEFADTFEEAVQICIDSAVEGDAVLLSPACASWGMFKNYEERGDKFKELVNQL